MNMLQMMRNGHRKRKNRDRDADKEKPTLLRGKVIGDSAA